MDKWVLGVFIVFVAAILIGLAACWKKKLPFAQKVFWSGIIITFPIAGALLYFLFAEEARDLLS
ncbi:MAG: hypothetical protein C4527_00405 [Candidatus Omnitrophota bacterium]|jgi:hypothetical protein|nr:MAG: hypothetical protein C4527_00405 [Candidatus Omnitrophota bacterium]